MGAGPAEKHKPGTKTSCGSHRFGGIVAKTFSSVDKLCSELAWSLRMTAPFLESSYQLLVLYHCLGHYLPPPLTTQ